MTKFFSGNHLSFGDPWPQWPPKSGGACIQRILQMYTVVEKYASICNSSILAIGYHET